MTNAYKLPGAIIVVLLVGFIQILINAKKCRRIRQLPLVVISAFLMIGVLVWSENKPDKMTLILRYIWEYIPLFKKATIVLENGVLLLGFVVLRLILLPVITLTFRKRNVLRYFAFDLYEYDDEYDEWFLRKQWTGFRKYFFAIALATNLGSGLFLGGLLAYGTESLFGIRVFPCAALVIINEIYNYFNGQTKEEYEYSIYGDDADARHYSNFYKLREIFENLLPDPLLSAHTGCEFIGTVTAADYIKQMSQSDDRVDRITAQYFESEDRYKTVNVDCVQATFQMMNGKNVLFNNPFYKDLGVYITLPMATTLLKGKKCAVICGRRSVAPDVLSWIEDLLHDYIHMRSLWRVGMLTEKEPQCEVGILTFNQIYDKRIINVNRDFLKEVDFVLVIEPSAMLNTSQIALSIIAGEMHTENSDPVYCVCDRNANGLVDTISHLLHEEITEVVAMPVPRCSYSALSWNVDGDFCRQHFFDKQTKYLGSGMELAAIAVKNQIPKVTWYGETKSPLRDIRWIAGQYYSTICRYMNLPSQQKSLYDKIDFVPNLWSAEPTKEEFIIAEDEFCNMFTMIRAYLSRGKNQTFVNVLSENYLLRDYMRCNRQMFMSNPDAIPSLVPDYAKTERNTILKIVLLMTLRPVLESEIISELHLVGIETEDVFETMTLLLKKYTYASGDIIDVKTVRTTSEDFTTNSSASYRISEEDFTRNFADSLKNAYYVLEDEKDNEGYIDAKLFGHVTQTLLPGQFVTYDGKYYMAKIIAPNCGVILRRASDQYDGRRYYRQIRKYHLGGGNDELISSRKIGDVGFAELRTDVSVDTIGYLDMDDYHNLRNAKVIDFSEDPHVGYYSRKYHNKSVLRIKLPESDNKIRFTTCMILSEIFKSVFPNGWQYLAMVTKCPEDIDGVLNYVVYDVESFEEDSDDYIYVIEDSDIDLGLLSAFEKNFNRMMEIAADFLEWHFEKMREPESADPVPVKVSAKINEENKKRGMVVKMLDRIRKLFGINKHEDVKIDTIEKVEKSAEQPAEQPAGQVSESAPDTLVGEYDFEFLEKDDKETDQPADTAKEEAAPEIAPVVSDSTQAPDSSQVSESVEADAAAPVAPEIKVDYSEDEFIPENTEDPDLVAIDGTDIFDNEGMPEDNDYLEASFVAMGLTPIVKSRYQRECFLKFGYEDVDSRIKVDELRRYLRVRGWSKNPYILARKREAAVKNFLDTSADNHCDFCGLPFSGVSYDRLNDGRVRCNDCSSSAINNLDDFKDLFYRNLGLMEDYFDIRFRVSVTVKMTDAKTIAKGAGAVFSPSSERTPRTLGYAQRRGRKYSVLLENGSPRLATINTMIHEMTHIWQYINWKDSDVMGIYGMRNPKCSLAANDILYEGMAMWAAIQYLYQIGETYFASLMEAEAEIRDDIYGVGFRLYRKQFPLVKDSSLLKYSPFMSFPPLEPDEVQNAVRLRCKEKECKC